MVTVEGVEFPDECPYGCGDTLYEDRVDRVYPRPGGSLVVVRDLPVLRCSECDELIIPSKSVKQVDELLKQEPDETVELPAYRATA